MYTHAFKDQKKQKSCSLHKAEGNNYHHPSPHQLIIFPETHKWLPQILHAGQSGGGGGGGVPLPSTPPLFTSDQ